MRTAAGEAVTERVPSQWRDELAAAVAATRQLSERFRGDPAVADASVATRAERVGDLRRPVAVVHVAPDHQPPAVPDEVAGVEVRTATADRGADAARPHSTGGDDHAASPYETDVDARVPRSRTSVAGGERVASRTTGGTATCRVRDADGTGYLLHAGHVFDVCGRGGVGDPALRDGVVVGRVADADARLDYVALAPSTDAVSFAGPIECTAGVDGHVTEAGVAKLMAEGASVAALGASSGWLSGRVTDTHRNRAACAGVGGDFVKTTLPVDRGDSGGPVFVERGRDDRGGRPTVAVVGLASTLGGLCSAAYAVHRAGGYRFG